MFSKKIDIYREFMKNIDYPTIIFSEGKEQFIFCNDKAEQLIGRNIKKAKLIPEKHSENESFLEDLHNNNNSIFSEKISLKVDNRVYKIMGFITTFVDDNKVMYYISFYLRPEKDSNIAILENIINNSKVIAIQWHKGIEWEASYVSKNINKFGYTAEQFYQGDMDWENMICPEDMERIWNDVENHFKSGQMQFLNYYRIITESQQIVPIKENLQLVKDKYGNVKYANALIEIIENCDKNDNDLGKNNYYKEIIDKSKVVVNIWKNLEKPKVLFVSDNIKKYGLNPLNLIEQKNSWFDLIHKDDIKKVNNDMGIFYKSDKDELQQTYRIITSDGNEHWIQENLLKVIDEDDFYIQSTYIDITKHKDLENKLLKSQQKLEQEIDYIKNIDCDKENSNLLDFLPLEDLQKMQNSLCNVNRIYMEILDVNGNNITKPTGPMENMGDFYDMFERKDYVEQYQKLVKNMLKEKTFCIVDRDKNNPYAKMVGVPIFVNDEHIATWIICSYIKEEYEKILDLTEQVSIFIGQISKYLYNGYIIKKEYEKSKIAKLDIEEKLEHNNIITDILQGVNKVDKSEHKFKVIFDRIGKYLNLTRISILEFIEDDVSAELVYEWDNDFAIKNIDREVFKTSKYFKNQREILRDKGILIIDADKVPYELKNVFNLIDAKAMLTVPIIIDNEQVGFITFIDSIKERIWNNDAINLIKDVTTIVQEIMGNRKNKMELSIANDTIFHILENIQECVAIKDIKTNKIIYANKNCRKLFDNDVIGLTCYKAFKNQDIKCANCHIKSNDVDMVYEWQEYSKSIDAMLHIKESSMIWLDGNSVRLVSIQILKN